MRRGQTRRALIAGPPWVGTSIRRFASYIRTSWVRLLSNWGRHVETALRAASPHLLAKPSAWNPMLGALWREFAALNSRTLMWLYEMEARSSVASRPPVSNLTSKKKPFDAARYRTRDHQKKTAILAQ